MMAPHSPLYTAITPAHASICCFKVSYLPKSLSLTLLNNFIACFAILPAPTRSQMIMAKIPWIVGRKLAWSIWLGNGIEFQLLPLTVLVFCLEMLINASLSSETSALESTDLRSYSDSFHDYANRNPLKLSHAIQLIVMDEDKCANSYCETFSGFECVSAWERDAFIFVYFEEKKQQFLAMHRLWGFHSYIASRKAAMTEMLSLSMTPYINHFDRAVKIEL